MATDAAAATHDEVTKGWADPHRRATSLVVGVALLRLRRPPRSWRGSRLSPARPRGLMKPVLSNRWRCIMRNAPVQREVLESRVDSPRTGRERAV